MSSLWLSIIIIIIIIINYYYVIIMIINYDYHQVYDLPVLGWKYEERILSYDGNSSGDQTTANNFLRIAKCPSKAMMVDAFLCKILYR